VISLQQLRDLGFSYGEVRGLLARGLLIRLYPGVYALGHANVGRSGRLLAALLACGPGAFLSHRTAAGVWMLRPLDLRAIELTVPGPRARRIRGLIVHRIQRPPARGEVSLRGPLRVSSPLRMLVELAGRETIEELERLITEGVRRQALRVGELPAVLAANARRRGMCKLRAAAERYLPRSDGKSGLEREVGEWIRSDPRIPEPQRNVHVEGWELDFWWPELRAALELDGRPYHSAVRDMDRDRLKDGRLAIAGIRLLRITDARWEHDQPGAKRDILALLGIES
jgi:hypothetical protein